MAQTLLSTMPVGRHTSRSTSSVRSVGTPDDRLGQAIQNVPAGTRRRARAGNVALNSARPV